MRPPHNVIAKEHNLIVRKHNGYCEGALFCLVRYSDVKMDDAKLITLYFELGLLQKDIPFTLAKEHRIIIRGELFSEC